MSNYYLPENGITVGLRQLGEDGPDGPGWYWYLTDYPDEGVVGPFDSRTDALEDARKAHY